MSTRSSGHQRPTILVVDADAASLAVIIEEVQTRYGRDYDVVSHSSADEALTQLRALRDSGQEVALILADQWLPRMSGVDLLAEAHQVARTARRALLIQWGDRSTAGPILRASALGHIDWRPSSVPVSSTVRPWGKLRPSPVNPCSSSVAATPPGRRRSTSPDTPNASPW